jgi:hypothetical protein
MLLALCGIWFDQVANIPFMYLCPLPNFCVRENGDLKAYGAGDYDNSLFIDGVLYS